MKNPRRFFHAAPLAGRAAAIVDRTRHLFDAVTGRTVQRLKEETERRARENDDLRRYIKRLSDFIDTSSDVVWEADADLAILSSHGARQFPAEGIGRRLAESIGVNPEDDPLWMAHLEDLRARRPFRGFEFSLRQPDGGQIWLEANGNPTFAKGKFQGYRGTYRDITQRKADEVRICFLASHDPLTNLNNRTRFRERVEQALALTEQGESFAVCCLDLDGFKNINDTLGHPVGDRLLVAVAERLSACVRETDAVARLGGDEFAILQMGLTQPAEAVELARRALAAISEPYIVDGHRIVICTSIGIAIAPTDGTHHDNLIKNADIALYRAKIAGRGTYRLFEAEMELRLQERRMLEIELRIALACGQFELFFQPIVDAMSQAVVAYEALLRWNHPSRGMIAPAAIIPLAEETGLIVPIGEWVLLQACREAATWPAHIAISVNLSPVQFDGDRLVETVTQALAVSGLSGSRLALEITEGVLLRSGQSTFAILRRLRALGAHISMDDFGAGYSSLGYLRNFPFDKIKIDKSFIQDLGKTPRAASIFRAMVGLGAALEMTVIAEGVETGEQLAIIQNEGCVQAQGYLFAKPKPAKEIHSQFRDFEAVA
jgi:diguanylate cyclase (GGDEF)-like protein/PAS domain S-box-containing protein